METLQRKKVILRYMMLRVILTGWQFRLSGSFILTYIIILLNHQPSMILHELCHGLHWRLKEKVDTVITEAYNIAKKSGKYEQVHHFNGSLG